MEKIPPYLETSGDLVAYILVFNQLVVTPVLLGLYPGPTMAICILD